MRTTFNPRHKQQAMKAIAKKCGRNVVPDKIGKHVPQKNTQVEVQIFKFYQKGRCNKEDNECRFKHPKLCRKFSQFFDCDIIKSQTKCKVVKNSYVKICSYTCIVIII